MNINQTKYVYSKQQEEVPPKKGPCIISFEVLNDSAQDSNNYYYIPIYLYMLNFPLPSGNIGQFFVLKKAQSCDYAKIPYYTGFWHCLYFIGWICSYSIVPRWRPKARLNQKQSNLTILQSIYGRSNSFKALTHTNSCQKSPQR